jgi:hypothetical protein
LASELGIPPMEETQALYAQIAPLASAPRPGFLLDSEMAALQQSLQQLSKALHACDTARERVQQALRRIERLAANRDQGGGNTEIKRGADEAGTAASVMPM